MSFIIWNVDPQIVSFLVVRWYGLLFAMGFIVSQQILYYVYRKEGKDEKDIDTLTIYVIIATIIGARLGHVFFYEPHMILERPLEIFSPIRFYPEFKIVGLQGLASHGGGIGILIAIWLYSRYDITFKKWKFKAPKIKRKGQSYLQILDRVAIVVAITACFIRFGNLMNSEIVGKPTDAGHGIIFARNVTESLTRSDSPIEEISYSKREGDVSEQGYRPINLQLSFKNGYDEAKVRGYIEGHFKKMITSYSYITDNIYQDPSAPVNYSLEQKRGQFIAQVKVSGVARHPAQLYESISSVLLFLILFIVWNKHKENTTPGRLFGIFLTVLFGLRFLYEFLKENQVDFEDNLPLNMGQWLSIPMIIAGIIILIRSFSSKAVQEQLKE
ncbi:MAG: prolipoprotein diacylglyceryl transferase [Cyclobacteriaceae bacterium]|nr:prolipoprotein diacylglyceryl transferase [Cyclobacteriaceae bacterium]